MFDFQKKKRIRKIIYSPFFLILLGIVFFLIVKGVWNIYKKNTLSLENLKQEQTERDKLVSRQANLAASIDYLKTDQGIESEIRSKFRAVKEGESVTVIIDKSVPTNVQATTTEKSFWQRLFNL